MEKYINNSPIYLALKAYAEDPANRQRLYEIWDSPDDLGQELSDSLEFIFDRETMLRGD